MLPDLLKAMLSGPLYFKIFSGVLLVAVIIWFIISFHIGQNPVTKEEEDKLSPKIDIKLYPSPTVGVTPHQYPLKRYELMVQNLNRNSAPIIDFRIEFIFANVVTVIKQMPLLTSGGNFSVGGINIYKKNKDGSVSSYEEQPIETAITKNFTLVIQQAKINDRHTNTNIVIFNCQRWPEEAAFSGDIIIDSSKKPELFKKPDRIGTYEGIYFYEIKGKKFSKKISGNIAN